MKKQRIQVLDNTFGRHTVYDVEAYCVGGTDGVLAVFEHESFPPDCVGFASGDDGNWWLTGTISRSEYVDNKLHYFRNSKVVSKIKNMILKKSIDQWGGIHYGLFDNTNKIISYQFLDKEENFYRSSMPITRPEYQGQGWMTYIMDYAVLNDKLTVASDTRQTPEAERLWRAMARNARYKIFVFNDKTNQKTLFKSNSDDPWDDTEDVYLITEYSHELAENQNKWLTKQSRIAERQITEESFYGPGTSSALFWNP